MTERPPGIDDLLDYVDARLEEPVNCQSCHLAFDATDTRFDGRGRFHDTVWCRACVDRCHDNEIADHRCAVCR